MAEKNGFSEAGLESVIDKYSLERILKEEKKIMLEKSRIENEVTRLIEDAKTHFGLYMSFIEEYLKKMQRRGRETEFTTIQFETQARSEYNYVLGKISEAFQYIQDYGFIRANQKIKTAIINLIKEMVGHYRCKVQEVPQEDIPGKNRRNAFIQFDQKNQIKVMLEEIIKKLRVETYNSKNDKPILVSEDMKDYSLRFLYFTLYPNNQNPEAPTSEPQRLFQEFADKCSLVGIQDVARAIGYLDEIVKRNGPKIIQAGYQSVVFEILRVVGGIKVKVVEYKKV